MILHPFGILNFNKENKYTYKYLPGLEHILISQDYITFLLFFPLCTCVRVFVCVCVCLGEGT